MAREIKTLEKCYDKLVLSIQGDPGGVADKLRPYNILTDRDIYFIKNLHHDDTERARKLLERVEAQVKVDPKVYHRFVEALKAAGEWTKYVVSEMETTYDSVSISSPLEEGKQTCIL